MEWIILGLAVFKFFTALVPDVGLGLYKEAMIDVSWGTFYLFLWLLMKMRKQHEQ